MRDRQESVSLIGWARSGVKRYSESRVWFTRQREKSAEELQNKSASRDWCKGGGAGLAVARWSRST